MDELPKNQKGLKVRTEYLAVLEEKDIRLKRTESDVIFRTEKGKVLAVPYASETAKGAEQRWWLGLPNEYFDVIILLCKAHDGSVNDFVLPRCFFLALWKDDLHWEWMRTGWRVQFDVRRRGSEYGLKLRGRKRPLEIISDLLGRIEILNQ
jgi:hypothetical protein